MDLISETQADQSSEKKIKNLATDFQVEWRLRPGGGAGQKSVHFRDGWMLLIGEAGYAIRFSTSPTTRLPLSFSRTLEEGNLLCLGDLSGCMHGDVTRLIALQTGPAPVMRFYHSSTRVVHITGFGRITESILWSTALHKAEDHRSATSSPRNWSPRWWKRFNMSPLWMFAWLSLLKSSLFFSALIVLDASMFACARPCPALRFELFHRTPRAFNFPFSEI